MNPAAHSPPPDEGGFVTDRYPRLRWLIPAVVAVAFLMEQLDSTILTTAIPDMARSLRTTPVHMNLAVSAYVLTLAVFIPLSGWFADRFGARRIFVLALALFTLGSALCGAVTHFAELIAMRVLQGFGGAMMTPVGRLILLRSFPRHQLVTAMTYMTLPAVVGPIIGPLLGGLLTTYASWRWIFYVNLPFGALGILLALRYMEELRGDSSTDFDFRGFALFGCGIASLQAALECVGRTELSPLWIPTLSVAAAGLLFAFVRYARTVTTPAVDLSLFELRSFSVGTLAGGLCRIGFNGAPFLLPLMLQVGFGMSPITSGSLTFLGSAGSLLVRLFISPALRHLGFRQVMIYSALLGSVTLAGFALLGSRTPHGLIGVYVVLFGLIRSLQFTCSNTLSYSDMPARQLSRATSLGGLIQQLTVSFGVSLGAVLLTLVTHGGTLTPSRFHTVFLLTAALPLLALPGFLRLHPEDGALVSGYRRRTH